MQLRSEAIPVEEIHQVVGERNVADEAATRKIVENDRRVKKVAQDNSAGLIIGAEPPDAMLGAQESRALSFRRRRNVFAL